MAESADTTDFTKDKKFYPDKLEFIEALQEQELFSCLTSYCLPYSSDISILHINHSVLVVLATFVQRATQLCTMKICRDCFAQQPPLVF